MKINILVAYCFLLISTYSFGQIEFEGFKLGESFKNTKTSVDKIFPADKWGSVSELNANNTDKDIADVLLVKVNKNPLTFLNDKIHPNKTIIGENSAPYIKFVFQKESLYHFEMQYTYPSNDRVACLQHADEMMIYLKNKVDGLQCNSEVPQKNSPNWYTSDGLLRKNKIKCERDDNRIEPDAFFSDKASFCYLSMGFSIISVSTKLEEIFKKREDIATTAMKKKKEKMEKAFNLFSAGKKSSFWEFPWAGGFIDHY